MFPFTQSMPVIFNLREYENINSTRPRVRFISKIGPVEGALVFPFPWLNYLISEVISFTWREAIKSNEIFRVFF